MALEFKYFETEDYGRLLHVSIDGIRFYPKWMIEEYASQHDTSMEDVLNFIQETSDVREE